MNFSLIPLRPKLNGAGLGTHPTLGQPFDKMVGMSEAVGDVIRLAVHGTATWLGFYVGQEKKGVLSALAYGFGIINGIGAFMDLVSLIEIWEGKR